MPAGKANDNDRRLDELLAKARQSANRFLACATLANAGSEPGSSAEHLRELAERRRLSLQKNDAVREKEREASARRRREDG